MRSTRSISRATTASRLALTAAAEREDYAPFEELLTVLAKPYEARPELAAYEEPPPPDQRVYRTFCGT